MDNYIQWLYPEDSIQVLSCFHNQAVGSYLPIITLFQQICARLDDGTEGRWREGLEDKEKGQNVKFGLWCFAMDARDPIQDVMIRYVSIDFEFCLYLSSKLVRLHLYIKQNQPYPDVYNYTPDRTPPTHAHARAHPHSPLADGIDQVE